jgi:hypothetical protein
VSAAWASRGQAIDHGQVVRVALDEEAFDRLVAGEMATVRGVTADGILQVEIIISDIGFDRMQAGLTRAADAAGLRAVLKVVRVCDADPRS